MMRPYYLIVIMNFVFRREKKLNNNLYILHNEELKKTLIFNKQFANSITVSREIYELIKDVESPDALRNLAKEFVDADREYLENLANIFVENHYFERFDNYRIQKIDFAVTDYCNLACTHCCFSAKRKQNNKIETIDMDIVKKIARMNPMQISITGGEPLLVSNILEIIEYFKKNIDGSLTIATNGTQINKNNVGLLCKNIDVFDISLDGIDAETTDKIRGKGVFDKVMASIKLLKENGAKKITVSMVFDDKTSKNIDAFLELCEKLEVEPMVRALNMVGRAKEKHTETSDEMTKFMSGGEANILGCYDCPGGVYELFVDCKGDLYPCGLFKEDKYKIGNIFDDDFQQKMKWDKSLSWFEAYSEYIPNMREECKDCKVNIFCWSCPSLAKSYMEYNGIKKFKPLCDRKRKELMETIWGYE